MDTNIVHKDQKSKANRNDMGNRMPRQKPLAKKYGKCVLKQMGTDKLYMLSVT